VRRIFLLPIFFILSIAVCFGIEPISLYQAGTLLNLTNGLYQGTTSLRDLLHHGEIGLGTINGPEGEMVIIDGKAYAANLRGDAHLVPENLATPFAEIVRYKPEQRFQLYNIKSLAELTTQLDKHLSSQNVFYVIKISAKFNSLQMRNWIKPNTHININEWIPKHQQINLLSNIAGTLVIIISPDFASPLTVPGLHAHFISDDKMKLGHVYNLNSDVLNVQVMSVNAIQFLLPNNKTFLDTHLKTSNSTAIKKIEANQ